MDSSDAIYELVRVLRGSSLSRNRNFEAHASAEARAARRIVRFLRGVEADVLGAERVWSRPTRNGGVVLELALPALKLERTVELDARAYALLMENAACAARLQGASRLASRVA